MPAALWPLPQAITYGDTAAVLVANASFFGTAPTALLGRAFERYAKLLPQCDDATVASSSGAGAGGAGSVSSFELRVDQPRASGPAEFMDESYDLVVPSRGVVAAHAATQWGALRALETFAQLVAADCSLQDTPVHVADAPRFTHRGVMLDLARRFWPADALFSVLDAMAHSKLNTLHLHLTDQESFMFESLAYPQLNTAAFRQPGCTGGTGSSSSSSSSTGGGGGEPCLYRQSMLRQLVAKATDRGIRVVPEFDMPAHAGSWGVAFPELVVNCSGCTAGGLPHVLLDPFQDETWHVVGAVLTEAAAIFPDARLHLGGDEVCWRCYNQSAAVRTAILGAGRALDDDGFKFVARTFIARAQAIVAALGAGRKTTVWNEAFGIYGPGDHGFKIGAASASDERTYSINTNLTKGTVVQHWWGGFGSWYDTGTGRVNSANATAVLEHGMSLINSEGLYLPIDRPKVWPYDASSMYVIDPATNKSCSYPAGGGEPNCTCHDVWGRVATGCYDIAPNAAGVYDQLLGGEACLWGNVADGPYNASTMPPRPSGTCGPGGWPSPSGSGARGTWRTGGAPHPASRRSWSGCSRGAGFAWRKTHKGIARRGNGAVCSQLYLN